MSTAVSVSPLSAPVALRRLLARLVVGNHAQRVRGWVVYLQLLATLLLLIPSILSNLTGVLAGPAGLLLAVLGVAAQVALLIAILITGVAYVRNRRALARISTGLALPEPELSQIRHAVAGAVKGLKLDVDEIRWCLDVNSKDLAPSALEFGGRKTIVVPPSFFDVMDRSPGVAQAILAHELAHLHNRDSSMWLLSTCYWKSVRRVVLPVQIVVSLLMSIGLILGAASFEEPITEDGTVVAMTFVGLLFYLWLPPALTFSMHRYLWRCWRMAEVQADLTAAYFADGRNLADHITEHRPYPDAAPEYERVHGTPDSRADALRDYGVAMTAARQEVPTLLSAGLESGRWPAFRRMAIAYRLSLTVLLGYAGVAALMGLVALREVASNPAAAMVVGVAVAAVGLLYLARRFWVHPDKLATPGGVFVATIVFLLLILPWGILLAVGSVLLRNPTPLLMVPAVAFSLVALIGLVNLLRASPIVGAQNALQLLKAD